jgi:hypothetical protein
VKKVNNIHAQNALCERNMIILQQMQQELINNYNDDDQEPYNN